MRVNVKPFFFGHCALIINISAPTGSAELSQRRIRFDCVGEVDDGLSRHWLGKSLPLFSADFAVGVYRLVEVADASQRFMSLMTLGVRRCYAEVSHG